MENPQALAAMAREDIDSPMENPQALMAMARGDIASPNMGGSYIQIVCALVSCLWKFAVYIINYNIVYSVYFLSASVVNPLDWKIEDKKMLFIDELSAIWYIITEGAL